MKISELLECFSRIKIAYGDMETFISLDNTLSGDLQNIRGVNVREYGEWFRNPVLVIIPE